MKYLDKPAIGNAGEYYFSYWISRYFQWPCRLLDIDVGIDAQIEIFDNKQHSTGNFLAAQIKTTAGENINTQVELNNLHYWKSMDDVVILVSIKMNKDTPEIYWKIINDEKIDQHIANAESNKSKTTTIEFRDDDLLKPSEKSRFQILPFRGEVDNVNKINDSINKKCKYILEQIWDEEYDQLDLNGNICDSVGLESIICDFDTICQEIDQVEELLNKHSKLDKYIENLYSHKDNYYKTEKCIRKLVDTLYEDGESEEDYKRNLRQSVRNRKVLEILKFI